MIKNAITYSVVMPQTSAEMIDHIVNNGIISREPGSQEMGHFGFVGHPITGKFVSEFPNGYCISFCEHKKDIKPSIVRQMVQEKVNALDYIPKRAEVNEMKEEVIFDLAARIPSEPKNYYAYYDIPSQTLIVDNTSQKVADKITALLRKTIGSLLAKTLYIDSTVGLTTRLSNYLQDEDRDIFIQGLTLGNTLVLKSHEGGSVTYKDMDLLDDITSGEIVELIRDHMSIRQLEMDLTGVCDFVLTDGFKLKKLNYPEYDNSDYAKNSEEGWVSDSWYSVQQIVVVMGILVKEFTVVEETPTAPSVPVPPGV